MPYDARAVLFDAGATLLLPTADIPDVYLREAQAVGAEPDRDAFRAHMAARWTALRTSTASPEALRTSEDGEREMWRRFTAEVAAPFPDLMARHEEWLHRLVTWFDGAKAWAPAPGALTLLRDLRARHIRVGIVSNWHGALHGILDGLSLRTLVDFVLVSSDHGWRKPHPSIFAAALVAANAGAEETVHVGDCLRDDVAGATRAGIRPILVASERPDGIPDSVRVVPGLEALVAD